MPNTNLTDNRNYHQLSLWSVLLPIIGMMLLPLFYLLNYLKNYGDSAKNYGEFASLIFLIILFSVFVAAICSIVLGIVSLVKIFKDNSIKGKWMSILGIFLGIILLLIEFMLILVLNSVHSY